MNSTKLSKWLVVPILMGGTLVGCAMDEDPDLPPDDQPGDELRIPGEGEHGSAMFLTEHGWEELAFVVQNGKAIHQGDINLGPVERVYKRPRGAVITVGDRWPDGEVFFQFGDTVWSGDRELIRGALRDLEDKIPVNFIESQGSGDFIRYVRADPSELFDGQSPIGLQGGEQEIEINTNGWNWTVIQHETLHSIGLWHEQARTDRGAHLMVNNNCIIDSEEDQYSIQTDSMAFGPYDFSSIMHYQQGAFCDKNSSGNCICNTMTKLSSGGSGLGNSVLSPEDVNTLWNMYSDNLAQDHTGDRYGGAVATGDFDGDGYADVAVGIPLHNIGSATDTGTVMVYKGTGRRLVFWKQLTQTSVGGSTEAGDHFGETLAVGDFNGDGFKDLAVGAPYEDVLQGGTNWSGSGAVFIWMGSSTGLEPDRYLTQSNISPSTPYTEETGDNFGIALAAGKIAGFTNGSIAVDQLAIGARNERNGSLRSGAVFIWYYDPPGSVFTSNPTKIVAPVALQDSTDDFGSAIAVRDLDNEGHADLVVGAPEPLFGGGAAYVFRGLTPTGFPSSWTPMATYVGEIRPSVTQAVDDLFGHAIAIGQFDGTGNREIAIGSPGRSSDRGRVWVFRPTTALSSSPTFTQVQTLSQVVVASDEAGDQFGSALAVGRFAGADLFDDLLVGVPGENTNAGAIYYLHGSSSGLGNPVSMRQTLWSSGDEDVDDRFGEAVAVANIDKFGPDANRNIDSPISADDFVIGAPGEEVEFGFIGGSVLAAGAIFTAVTWADTDEPDVGGMVTQGKSTID